MVASLLFSAPPALGLGLSAQLETAEYIHVVLQALFVTHPPVWMESIRSYSMSLEINKYTNTYISSQWLRFRGKKNMHTYTHTKAKVGCSIYSSVFKDLSIAENLGMLPNISAKLYAQPPIPVTGKPDQFQCYLHHTDGSACSV